MKILSKLVYLWPIVLLAIVVFYFKKANDEKSSKEEKKINQERTLRIKDSLETINFEKNISQTYNIKARIDTINNVYSNAFAPLLRQNLLLSINNDVYIVDKYKDLNGKDYIDIFIDNRIDLFFKPIPVFYPIILRLDANDLNILPNNGMHIVFMLDYVKKETQSINITLGYNDIENIPIYFYAQGRLLQVLDKETYHTSTQTK
ncbi:MAG: hypothetical protein RLZZ546_2582 [Bacteroidota bacterium]|jgi:hypothetical protein